MASIKIAVMLESVQLSDIMGVDIIGNCSTEYVQTCIDNQIGNPSLLSHTTGMEFLYLAETTKKPLFMTPSMLVHATTTYDDCPRDVDILLIGGPLPSHRPESSMKFLREVKAGVVMTTCIGALWLADAGVLKGKNATTNRQVLPMAKMLHPDVKWLDQRWVVDDNGKLWTSGGAQAGIDMVATYVQQKFHPDLAKFAIEGLDVDASARGQFYQD